MVSQRLRSRDVRPVGDGPACDVARRDVVGGSSEPALHALKCVPRPTVQLRDKPAARALLTLGGQSSPKPIVAAAEAGCMSSRVGFAVGIAGEINQPRVDAQPPPGRERLRRRDAATCVEVEVPSADHELTLADPPAQQLSLPGATRKTDALAPPDRPDRHLLATPAKKTPVKDHRACGSKDMRTAPSSLVGASDSGDDEAGRLGGQTKSAPKVVICEVVQIEAAKGLAFECQTRQPVGCGIAPLDGVRKRIGLCVGRVQSDRSCERNHYAGTYVRLRTDRSGRHRDQRRLL